jgi:hypothetical protein
MQRLFLSSRNTEAQRQLGQLPRCAQLRSLGLGCNGLAALRVRSVGEAAAARCAQATGAGGDNGIAKM